MEKNLLTETEPLQLAF